MEMVEELSAVKEQVGNIGSQVGEMNQRMEGLEASVETIKGYLRDLRDSTIGRETGDRGKTPTRQEPHPFYLPPERETTMPWTRSEGGVVEEEATCNERREKELLERNQKDVPFHQLDLLVFDGEDAINWIFKVERYFDINLLMEKEKLVAVGVCMKGEALSWFK